MKSASLALALAVVALVAGPASLAAQETKMARGTVTDRRRGLGDGEDSRDRR